MSKSDECPSCGSDQILDLDNVPHPICTACGVVLSDNPQIKSGRKSDDNQPSKPKNWTDHYTVSNSTEEQVANALNVLEEVADQLEIDQDVRADTARLYAETAIENVTDGRSTEIIIAGLLCIVTRCKNEPIPQGYVAEELELRPPTLKKTIRVLSRDVVQRPSCTQPSDYLTHFCHVLDLNGDIETLATEMLDNPSQKFSGKNPAGIAAASIYLCTGGSITQRQLARAAGVTTETIRVRLADMREGVDQ